MSAARPMTLENKQHGVGSACVFPFGVEDIDFKMFLDSRSLARLDVTLAETLDAAKFGIVVLNSGGEVLAYNKAEAALSGLDAKRVIGRQFFASVAPCTNNVLVAHRFETEAVLDVFIDYVFTFQMAPSPVRLRLIKHPDARRMYLFVERRLSRDG